MSLSFPWAILLHCPRGHCRLKGPGQSMCCQHRIALVKYAPTSTSPDQGGGLMFLCQVRDQRGIELLDPDGAWLGAAPCTETYIVNFSSALETATEKTIKATTHTVGTLCVDSIISRPIIITRVVSMNVLNSFIRTQMVTTMGSPTS
ncbi:hypothetical protein P154DRAFT_165969 [Amniculicola lignicola CBS 123094]|uniref:Uncharacterized protein n=1 Tax=Amniculicola lignicola CBS 123094 TaxID=1392246 RepID=A0A6A5WN44_9PLEO|nr:hypothetical protein P154DRAFT_165969 [Amniculicola lignicola CBS 123094]